MQVQHALPTLHRRQRHHAQSGTVSDHTNHAVEALSTNPDLQASPQVQGLFFQMQGQGAVAR
ncbi:hypothetical protein D3C77_799420 [compost metagenome]